ncbi:hypothetical protein [Thermococcus sp.]
MSEREKKEYICLRCGNVYSSRAKEPQCPICRSRRRMELDKFLALPKEQQEKLLGKSRGGKKAENTGKYEESTVNTAGNSGKSEEKTVKYERESGKYEETQNPTVKYEDSATGKYEEKGKQRDEKPGEKVKGERVKGLKVPLPRLSWKAYAIVGGLAFAYYLYKVGWFDEMWRQLRNLGVVKDLPDDEQANPFLERARRNIAGAR